MKKRQFKALFVEKLKSEGKKPNKTKVSSIVRKVGRYIRKKNDGETIWSKSYLKVAMDFYTGK